MVSMENKPPDEVGKYRKAPLKQGLNENCSHRSKRLNVFGYCRKRIENEHAALNKRNIDTHSDRIKERSKERDGIKEVVQFIR